MLEVRQLPGDMSALELDRADPKRCLVAGFFEESVKVGEARRRFYTYIAPGLCHNQPCLVLAPPEGVPVLEFLEHGFWLSFARERQIFLHILEPENGKYRLDGTDAAYMNKVYVEIQSRKYYVTMQDNIYAVGIGGGAAVAQQAAMEMASEWSGLAAFGEMVPEAGVYQQRPGGLRNVLLWNGNYMGEPLDDVPFVLALMDDIKGRYAIDPSRVYACGQSSGGMMTSQLALRAPGVFAAVSPWSAIVDPDHELVLPEKIDPAVPCLFLFWDSDWLCVDREHGELEYHAAHDIAAFLKHLMELYQLDENPRRYTCGEISYNVYLNAKRVPMLTVGTVKGMSHANYPRESWIAYDEFLSKFSKRADGTLLYMGEEIL